MYDSLFDKLTPSTEKQLQAMCYKNLIDETGKLHVEICFTQKVRGSVDCGLFAVAYAYELASGDLHPNNLAFNQRAMRSHLATCLRKKEISSFPHHKSTVSDHAQASKELVIHVFCSCQLPEQNEMVQCDLCDNFYHLACLNLK